MPIPINVLPSWMAGRRYCTVKDLMRTFDVSRATIDRWSRENPAFPAKIKLGVQETGNCSTRFMTSEVAAYLERLEGRSAA